MTRVNMHQILISPKKQYFFYIVRENGKSNAETMGVVRFLLVGKKWATSIMGMNSYDPFNMYENKYGEPLPETFNTLKEAKSHFKKLVVLL